MGIPNPHKTIIENWHLELDEVTDLGYRLLDAAETRNLTGCATPSVQLDYEDLYGNFIDVARWRLYDPSKVPMGADPRKYTSKKGTPVALFLPRGLSRPWKKIARNPDAAIYITEGEAKALYAVVRHQLACIGIQGIAGWQAQGVPAAQFAWFKWSGRRVILIPDSDYQRNPDIRRWFARLGKHLESLGAKVRFRLLPDLVENFNKDNPDKRKTGLDDWFHHTGADFDKFKALPTLPLSHKYIESWDSASATLPEMFRSLSPVDPAWLDQEPPLPQYIVPPYLQTNEVAQFAGQAGVSKSTWAMYLAASLTTGLPFFGIPIKQAYSVLYCMLERHTNSFRRRWNKICTDVLATIPELERGTIAKAKKNVTTYPIPRIADRREPTG